jgi:hypothetical protein
MHVMRTFRMSAAVLAATLTVGALGTGAAEAGKPLPKPTGLAATVTPHPGDTYDVAASWDVSANATAYKVALTKGGTTLVSTKVATNSWSATVTTTPGDATLSVRAVAGRKPGRPATFSVTLPDVTAPSGSFSAASDNSTGEAVITQDALSDDSGASQVTRTVDWGDGSAAEVWAPGATTIDHAYTLTPVQEVRFPATVTVEDAAHNQAVVDVVPAPVFNDHTAPTGSFSVSPAAAWARFTKVVLTQTALNDDRTPDGLITRSVDWGDGTTTNWTGTGAAKHVYTTVGTRTPNVVLTDEAGNSSAPISTSAVVVTADTVRPKVTLVRPRPQHSVKAWKTLHGKATDAGTGVKSVSVKAVEKRGRTWYAYNAATTTWVKAATKAKALAKTKAIVSTPNARHRWSAKLVGLRKGTLIVKVRATDHVKNRSVVLSRKASLTAR